LPTVIGIFWLKTKHFAVKTHWRKYLSAGFLAGLSRIAYEMDWPHRDMIWELAGLQVGDKPAFKCAFES